MTNDKTMTLLEKSDKILECAEADALTNELLSKMRESGKRYREIIDYVYSLYFEQNE